jgi:hypothetical protein
MPKTTPEQNKALVLEAFDTLFNKRDYTGGRALLVTKLHPTQRAHSARSRRIVRPDPLTAANTAL